MKISLFVLDANQKRRLIEIMLIVFSIMVVLPTKINITSNTFGAMPALFLILSILFWIISHEERTNESFAFRIVALVISISFSAMLSTRLIEFMILPHIIILKMIFWFYYLASTSIIYLALTSSPRERKIVKWYLKPWGEVITAAIFIVFLYLLSRFF